MKNKYIVLYPILFLFLLVKSSNAFFFCDPTISTHLNEQTIEVVFDYGSRNILEKSGKGLIKYGTGEPEVEPPLSNNPISLRSQRLYLQTRGKIGNSLSSFFRILPKINQINFENSQYNPKLWGMGVGFQISLPPDIITPFNMGLTASYDWNYGAQNNVHYKEPSNAFIDLRPDTRKDEINWTEINIAGGFSYEFVKNISIYGGISYIDSNIFVELEESETHWKLEKNIGGYLGFLENMNEKFKLNFEAHLFNENILSMMLAYNW